MIGKTRWHFHTVDSTQNVAFRLAELGAESGTVVRAGFQSAGRGRLGRSWESSPDTALMFSMLLRPTAEPHELGSLAIRIADVLCDSFTELGSDSVSLKWPNDVLISGRKVSGILVQTRMMPSLAVVVGIGINISDAPPDATCLHEAIGESVENDHVFDVVLAGLDKMWASWHPKLTQNQLNKLEEKLSFYGQAVELHDADRVISGTIAGIAPDGGLRLISEGREQIVRVGEITRGPRPMDHP